MKLALIGKGFGREQAPLKGSGITTWGVNDIVGHRDVDICFYMDRDHLRHMQIEEVIKTSINTTGTPLYCIEHYDDIPSSMPYPKDEIIDFFGIDYFADSFAYMLALAIYQGFKQIDIYGFNYAFGEAYVSEKPCCEFWIGIALQRGIEFNLVGDNCKLLRTRDEMLYSYKTPQQVDRSSIKLRQSKPELKEHKFSVRDRVILLGLLPRTGNYTTMQFSRKLRTELLFSVEENTTLNMRQVKDKEDGEFKMIWDDNELPDRFVELTDAESAMITAWLHAVEYRGELNYMNLKLYERYCVH